jgi:galactose mutarotase-like enzyme
MVHKISNNYLTISLYSKGAELFSIQKNHPAKIEYMWDGNKQVWGRHAPNLFPITGKLKESRYELKGKSYNMPVHGFAKDYNFQVVEKTNNKIIFLLESNNMTKEVYPYDFQLFITYELINSTVLITYKVVNSSLETMYFSIGGHPGFKCPLFDEELLQDYFLEFEHKELEVYRHSGSGFLSKESSPFSLMKGKCLPLTPDLFKGGVYVIKSPHSNWVAIKNKNSNHSVTVSFEDFPFLCLWAKPNSRFICIEPWYGVTDVDGSSYDVTLREGIMKLEKNTDFKCQYSIKID